MASKVAIASQLKAENIQILGLNDRNKERESPFRNRQLSKLKIVFNLAENEVAPIEGKKIMIRIIDENGQVLFDVARGSGTFMYNGKEEFYTAAQEILFDNTRQQLSFIYEKGSDYADGSYTLEIYADDVRCAHGATISQLNETSLFYLQSRGVERAEAISMLSFGFINELLTQVPEQAIQDYLRPRLTKLFGEGSELVGQLKYE